MNTAPRFGRRIASLATAISLALLSSATLLPGAASALTASQVSLAQQQSVLKDAAPVLGASKADVTVVEYFDYNCSYCRKLAPSLQALVESDQKVAVLYKEWPIFGGVSVYAARSALAAQYQGKYLTAHEALITAPRLAQPAQVDETLRKAGVDIAQLKKDLDTHGAQIDTILARNDAEAHALGIRGTPGLLVGRNVSTGIGDLAGLQGAVSAAR